MDTQRQRPVGLLLVAALLVFQAIFLVAGLTGRGIPVLSGGLLQIDGNDVGRGVIVAVVAANLLAAFGLVMGWRWGWALSMVLVGVLLIVAFVAWYNGDFHAIRMAIGVAAAFYLNQTEVRDYFDPPTASMDPAGP